MEPPVLETMQVIKYIPEKMYGFLLDQESREVFFHLRIFHPRGGWMTRPEQCAACPPGTCPWPESQPPPILGEKVSVEKTRDTDRLRARNVYRLTAPIAVLGVVETFDPVRGYGFICGNDGNSYHLHRSEVLEGRMPLPGHQVFFHAGMRQQKPRACNVKICKDHT